MGQLKDVARDNGLETPDSGTVVVGSSASQVAAGQPSLFPQGASSVQQAFNPIIPQFKGSSQSPFNIFQYYCIKQGILEILPLL